MDDTLEQLKYYRRCFVDLIEKDGFDSHRLSQLATLQTAIEAFEVVKAEPKPVKTGPRVVYGEDGWPQIVEE